MQLIRQTTDLDVKDALILQVAEATHHLASVLATTNERFWSFPTDRLLAVLNADIPATLATFQANSALAAAVNSSLDALNLLRSRDAWLRVSFLRERPRAGNPTSGGER